MAKSLKSGPTCPTLPYMQQISLFMNCMDYSAQLNSKYNDLINLTHHNILKLGQPKKVGLFFSMYDLFALVN